MTPLAISGPMVTAAAQNGDGVARDAFAQIGHWLGVAMADLAQILDPQVLVVGGGVIDAGDLLMGPTGTHATASSWRNAAGCRWPSCGPPRPATPPGSSAPPTSPGGSGQSTYQGRGEVTGVPLRVLSYNVHGLRDDRPPWPAWSATSPRTW